MDLEQIQQMKDELRKKYNLTEEQFLKAQMRPITISWREDKQGNLPSEDKMIEAKTILQIEAYLEDPQY